MMTKIEALKCFFSTSEKPVSTQELADLRQNDPRGFDELAEAAREALEAEVPKIVATTEGADV